MENRGADALSRLHEEGGSFGQMKYVPSWEDSKEIIAEVQQDEKLKLIIADLEAGKDTRPGFSYTNGVLLFKGKLVVSASSSWIPKLISEYHSTPQGGHSGFYRTYRRLAGNLFWLGMKKIIQEFVQKCDVCQRQKYLATAPGGLLQPLSIPE